MSHFQISSRLLCVSLLIGLKSLGLKYGTLSSKTRARRFYQEQSDNHLSFIKLADNASWEEKNREKFGIEQKLISKAARIYRVLCEGAMSDVIKSQNNVVCLKNVGASEGKSTDVIVAGRRSDATEHIIFFGGDVQDYPENMLNHRDNGRYVQWNSIATAELLAKRFPTAMVMVIKPQHMHLNTFSVYSQFVESNDFGCPKHSHNYGAWRTLNAVYQEAVKSALASPKDVCSETENIVDKTDQPLQDGGSASSKSMSSVTTTAGNSKEGVGDGETHVPIHLIGFSKGCIVLNQLLYELEAAGKDGSALLSRVHAMTWLDGGHSGGRDTWVTDRSVLKRFASYSITVNVHVTPYQVGDEMRAWIGKEKRKFVEQLVRGGMKINDQIHFEDEPKSIENHFRVLEVF